LHQDYRPLEIIVIDDGSTDATRAVLAPFGDSIMYVYQNNAGLPSARNAGINIAKGDFVAFLDADDIWCSNKLSVQMEPMLSDKNIGLVSCDGMLIDEQDVVVGRYKKLIEPDRDRFIRSLILGNVISGGSNAVIRKECFQTVGLFDESLKAAEDWDMWLRISLRYPMMTIPAELVKIRVLPDSMSAAKNLEKMLYFELIVLNKVFSMAEARAFLSLRIRAFSARYYSAAVAYLEVDDRLNALKYWIKSFAVCPFPLGMYNQSRFAALMKILCGEYLFKAFAALRSRRKV